MFAVFACGNGPDSVYSVHAEKHEADFVCNEMNIAASDFPDPADYRVAEMTTIIRPDDIDTLCALHYYGWEHPGNTWDGIPPDVVKAGLDGLAAFLRIAQWSRDQVDPDTVTADEPF
jgi:hypothetical protein